ncbi:hypothetical protein V8C86DRAFT_2506089 [Haematococcus lacustris]
MDRYIEQWRDQREAGGRAGARPAHRSHSVPREQMKQMRIQDCPKVQVLETSHIAARPEDLQDIRDGLIGAGSTEETLHQLRRLACYELGLEQLVDSQVGPVVRSLKSSPDPEVSRLATNLLEKLRGVVKRRAKHDVSSAGPTAPQPTAPSQSTTQQYTAWQPQPPAWPWPHDTSAAMQPPLCSAPLVPGSSSQTTASWAPLPRTGLAVAGRSTSCPMPVSSSCGRGVQPGIHVGNTSSSMSMRSSIGSKAGPGSACSDRRGQTASSSRDMLKSRGSVAKRVKSGDSSATTKLLNAGEWVSRTAC